MVELVGREGSDVAEAFGKKQRVAVKGTINGAPFRRSLMNMGEGHMMFVNAGLRRAAGCKAGDLVEVVMEGDDEERSVEIPSYLIKIMERQERFGVLEKPLLHPPQGVRSRDRRCEGAGN